MKVILRAIFGMLLLAVVNTWAMDIEGSHSGSWFNKYQSGHGFSFEVLDENRMVVYWFVYTPDGEPTFLVSLANIQGDTAQGTLHQYSGMLFGEFDPATLTEEVWGTLAVTFWGCDSALVTYQSAATHQGLPYGSGTIELTRLTNICSLDCSEPQQLVEYGNYVADVIENGSDIGDADIMILKNGAMAYHFSISDVYYESGFGKLTMTSDTEFDFVASVEHFGTYRDLFSDKFIFWGSGNFSDGGVSLEAPYDISLNGIIDPAVYAGVSMERLAGTYQGTMPGDLIPQATLHIDEAGLVTGTIKVFYDYQVTGEVTIPDPEMNQFQIRIQISPDPDTHTLYSSIATIRGGEMDLITETRVNNDYIGTFEWILSKQ